MPGKVLVADDSLKTQKELTQILQEAGVEVATVSNGEHAVRKLGSVQPDLVLADIFMPVRSGYEVCEYIKKSEEFGHVRVLLLVSKMEPFDEKEAQRVRADGKLEKPFADREATLNTIKQHLEKVLAQKPAPAAPPIEEFAAAVPAEAAPEPEPEPEPFATRPPPVTFEQQAAPIGFTELVEEAPPAAAPSAAAPSTEEVVDLSQATILTSADELKRRLQAQPAAPAEAVVEEAVVEEAVVEEEEVIAPAEVVPAEEPTPAPIAAFEAPPPAPAADKTVIAKPELAAAWEMTVPPPGAPAIPAAGGWDSQWAGGEEAAAATAEAPPVEEAAPVEEAPARPYAPEEFAAAFGTAVSGEAPPAAAEVAAVGMDPALIDEVVNRVLERLSPQVMETIAREIVRPLAEALLREKLQS